MKYEMIFGDEKLFDGCDENAIAVIDDMTGKCKSSKIEFFSDDALNFETVDVDSRRIKLAMRRIIKEPKRWTWEDKKAGRLPEVGSRVDFCHKLNTNWRTGEIKYIDNQVVVIKADDIDRPFVYEFDRVKFKPIETQEERAQRLRSEWIDSSLQKIKRRNWTDAQTFSQIKEFIGDIYDAQLSGELQAPTKGE